MTKRFFIPALIFVIFSVVSAPAIAQRCIGDYELMIDMNRPNIGSYNVWDATYGEQDRHEKFSSGVVIKNKNTVVAGESYIYEGGDVDLLLVEFDRRGRAVMEQIHKIAGLREVKKIVLRDQGYLVVANTGNKNRDSKVWLGFFDAEGNKLSHKIIGGHNENMSVEDIIPFGDDSNDYLLAINISEKSGRNNHGSIYKIDKKGNILTHRSYAPGLDNKILGIALSGSDYFMATGYIRGEDGRKSGWAVRLTRDLGIVWQRQYPRGRSATIRKSSDFIYDYTVVVGNALPIGRGKQAGWVMLINETNGDIVWQRYYSAALHQYGRDLVTSDDGLISVLFSGRAFAKEKESELVRLLTLNSRGALFISDGFYNAEGSQASQLLMGSNKERIIIGSTDVSYQVEGPEGPDGEALKGDPIQSREGWIIAATATEPYDDPCVSSYSFLP